MEGGGADRHRDDSRSTKISFLRVPWLFRPSIVCVGLVGMTGSWLKFIHDGWFIGRQGEARVMRWRVDAGETGVSKGGSSRPSWVGVGGRSTGWN